MRTGEPDPEKFVCFLFLLEQNGTVVTGRKQLNVNKRYLVISRNLRGFFFFPEWDFNLKPLKCVKDTEITSKTLFLN